MKPTFSNNMPDWIIALATMFGMLVTGVVWIARLPYQLKEQQARMTRIEEKMDEVLSGQHSRTSRIEKKMDDVIEALAKLGFVPKEQE